MRRVKAAQLMSVSEVGNQHGYLCPSCLSGASLHIQAVIHTEVTLYPDGTEDAGGDTEWGDRSVARCSECGWRGRVTELKTVELED